jgi:pyruvate-ferredoxin/flavodoxin oxidoreductase
VWETFPVRTQQYIADKKIRVFYLDAFKIAREESSNPDLQLRMQGNAFQGAFFRASDVKERAGLSEETLFTAIENQLESKFGKKGKRIVEDNLRVVRRGYQEIFEILVEQMKVGQRAKKVAKPAPSLPVMLKQQPEGSGGLSDIHRFWEQTGSFYMKGEGSSNLVDPFMGLSVIPAVTGVYRDMTGVRFEHPEWDAEKCTACGECFTQCPDSAIPGLVSTTADILNTAIQKIEIGGRPTRFLRKFSRAIDKKLRNALDKDGLDVRALLANAITEAFAEDTTQGDDRGRLEAELNLLREQIGGFKFATTKPYWTQKEKKEKGTGGLFSITVNPYTCKGCALCVEVCEDDALKMVTQTQESIETMRDDWNFWLDLPTTPPQFSRIDDLDEKVGVLETLLLDKHNYQSLASGDGACLGCGEKGTIHLFTATVTALQQPRVKKFVAKLDRLIADLENHIRLKLSSSVDLTDPQALMQAAQAHNGQDLTLANLSASILQNNPGQPIDPQWLRRVSQMLEKMKDLRWRYMEGPSKRGRAEMGVVNSTGCTSVWASTFPFNPYPFPWTSHLFQDSPSVAMGVFEGHMAKMVEGFKTVRQVEMELAGGYDPVEQGAAFAHFNWEQLSNEEWLLCPPVVAIGGDGAMFDIGFQNLSRALMSGKPIKVMIVDTQVYSNTGGQACTSGFISQVADMSPYGAKQHGKTEKRKEISVIGMAHRTSFILQGSLSNTTHLLEGFIDGLNSRRPALFNVYAVCPPEHGVGDNSATAQSKMAVESRAFPLFRYDPDAGVTFSESVTLEGNPSLDADWLTYKLDYADESGEKKSMTLPMTFADFALSEGRFAKQFKKAPPETWNDDMVLLGDFLALSEDERDGKFPYIWTVDKKNRLMRVLVSAEMVRSCEERMGFWKQLKDLAGLGRAQAADESAIADRVRQELIQQLSSGLTSGGSGAAAQPAAAPAANAEGYEAVWVDTPECTACDECININPKVFAYDETKKVVILNPKAGSYLDLVKAAEKCTAGVIHPGTPWNPGEPNLDKLKARAAKFN